MKNICSYYEKHKFVTNIKLPQWLDFYIFNELGAKYCQSCSNITVIDWDKNDVLNYLGTYFPRSFAESYCILNQFFKNITNKWVNVRNFNIFDFGCGTGGEIIGMALAIKENIPDIKRITVKAVDGNSNALRLLEKIANYSSSEIGICIDIHPTLCKIDDFYDLSILNKVIDQHYDIIMSVKAICELITKDCFDNKNAYEYIIKFMLPKLNNNGILFLEDITIYNDVSQKWLPEMIDKGLEMLTEYNIWRNNGFNQTFTVSHSKRQKDTSKVAWRIIQKSN